MEKNNSFKSSALLVLTAFIWGVAFVAQSEGMRYVGGFTFIGCRYLLSAVVLLPVIRLGRRKSQRERNHSIRGGICCGFFLFVASAFQQFGIAGTTVGKAGFISALYIVIVPLLGVFLGKRVRLQVVIGILIATVGMYLLCITDGFSVGRGDVLVFLCAVTFSLQILSVDHFSVQTDGVMLACAQFFTAGILGVIAMLLTEQPTLAALAAGWLPIVYAGVLSGGVGYTLQILAQRDLEPTLASLLMSLESVFALLAGWLLLKQTLTGRELLGCALVFIANVLTQLP